MIIIRYNKKRELNEDDEQIQNQQETPDNDQEQGAESKGSPSNDEISKRELTIATAQKAIEVAKKAYDDNVNTQKRYISNLQTQVQSMTDAEQKKNAYKQIAAAQERIAIEKKKYDEVVNTQNPFIAKAQSEIADLGGEITPRIITESMRTFSYKLYESITCSREEMNTVLTIAVNSIDELTYVPNKTRLWTIARTLQERINKEADYWREHPEDDHSGALEVIVRDVLRKSQVKFTEKDIDRIIEKLFEQMKKTTVFMWIFKNENTNQ